VGYGEDVVATARRLWQRAQLTEVVAVVMLGSPSVPEGAEVERAVNIHLTRPDNFKRLRRLLCSRHYPCQPRPIALAEANVLGHPLCPMAGFEVITYGAFG
jgi:hypothetical protein